MFYAGSVMAPDSPSTPQGIWEAALKAAVCGLTSAAKAADILARSRASRPSTGGRIGGGALPGAGWLIRVLTDLALIRRDGGDVDKAHHVLVRPGLGGHFAAVGVADQAQVIRAASPKRPLAA